MNMIYRRRTASAEGTEASADTQGADTGDQETSNLGEKAQQVRALISRMADLTHYRAFDDIDFLIRAIGEKNYQGSPALDVLPSHEDISRELREKVKEYIYCLSSWADGKDLEDVVAEFKADEKLLRNTYAKLGTRDEEKKTLALSLTKSLEEKVSSPEDVVAEIPDEEFIIYVYNTILGRDPDDDDLKLRSMELKRGRSRQDLIKDILESRESHKRMLSEIAESIRKSSAGQ